MKYSRLVKTSLFALGLSSAAVFAATQGSLGTTSTGDLIINLDIDSLVRVNNLNDIDLGTFSGGAGDLSGADNFCIYRNGAGNFNITMTGSGAGSAFTLTDGTNTLPYSVEFTNSTPNAMTAGTLLAAQSGAFTANDTCDSGASDNVSVSVTVANGALASVPAGSYTGTLTMVVAPE